MVSTFVGSMGDSSIHTYGTIASVLITQRDAEGTTSVSMDLVGCDTKRFTLTREMLYADLSNLQKAWDQVYIDGCPQETYSGTASPKVGFRDSNKGFWASLNHNIFMNESLRPSPNIILSCMQEDDWCDEQAKMVKEGCSINPLDGAHHHILYVKLGSDGTVVHFSDVDVTSAQPVDVYYYTVDHPQRTGHAVVQLLPRFLTNTVLSDDHICFVYMHIVPRMSYDERVVNAAYALVHRPLVLVDMLEHCSDRGRRRVIAGDVRAEPWEFVSARIVVALYDHIRQYLATLHKKERHKQGKAVTDVCDYIFSEMGRNQLQDALQYNFTTHPAHLPKSLVDSKQSQVVVMRDILWGIAVFFVESNYCHARECAMRRDSLELQRRQQVRGAVYDVERQTTKDQELQRRRRAQEGRDTRLASGSLPFTSGHPARQSAKGEKTMYRQQRRKYRETNMMAVLEHDVHIDPIQRGLRANAFNARQTMEHTKANARKARTCALASTKLLKDMSAAHAASVHTIPPRPTLFDMLGFGDAV